MKRHITVKDNSNKLFKSDSARVAFLLCVGFGVEVPCSSLVIACFTPQLGVMLNLNLE
ncbi:TPA: DUF3265 domain-containing protein [Vibrio parahaemolyticus]|nr:DUF3265 domain-containing protein [Vibrio parahaemolyticus]